MKPTLLHLVFGRVVSGVATRERRAGCLRTWVRTPHRQSVLGIQPIGAFRIEPREPSLQNRNRAAVAEAHPVRRHLAQARPEPLLRRPTTPVAQGLAGDRQEPQRSTFAQRKDGLD